MAWRDADASHEARAAGKVPLGVAVLAAAGAPGAGVVEPQLVTGIQRHAAHVIVGQAVLHPPHAEATPVEAGQTITGREPAREA